MYKKLTIFLVICFAFFYASAEKLASEPVGITSAKVQMKKLFDLFNVMGMCKNDNSRDYYANVSGKLEEISLNQGEQVKKGDVLLVIDKEIALKTKTQAEAALKAARDEYIRNQALFTKRYISAEILEKSQSNLENAKLTLSKSLKTYNDMFIIAPFDGVMGVIQPKIGDDIKQGDYLFSIIGDGGTQSIFLELPESLYGKVSSSTEIIINDNNSQIKGKIALISKYISNTGTVNAKVTISNNKNILHGSYVDVSLILNPHTNISVPEQCIQRNNQGNFIYKIVNDVAKQVYVVTGTRTDNFIEITSPDIHEGDLVIFDGFTKVDDGSLIKLLDKNPDIAS